MERFQLKMERLDGWVLRMFPLTPGGVCPEGDARLLWHWRSPSALLWLRPFVEACRKEAEIESGHPAGLAVWWLSARDALRLALAGACYVTLREVPCARLQCGILEMPEEVLLYWFTLCFYGDKQRAARASLRTLFVHEGSGFGG